MIDKSDALDRLAAANPVPPGVAATVLPDPLLLNRIVAGGMAAGQRRSRGVRRRAARLLPVLLGTSLLGGAAAYGLLRGEVSKPHTVACYAAADLEARTEVAGVDRRGPEAACAELWREGAFGRGPVPELVTCTLDSGVVGVFPSVADRDVCTMLAVAPTPTGRPPQPAGDTSDRFLAVREAVLPQFVGAGCVEPRAGAAIVRRALDEAGLAGWAVRGGEGSAAEGYTPERPCATLTFEPDAEAVVLVPASPRR